ncbi:MAG: DotU family type IV/VI secretion system protein, partial [Chitinivibrionales bacterium]|nr:DotU family type IV/VI secretion system protein [Chitinivibrionales bacterium]
EKMVQEPQRMKDIIEIFYICLALGFEGKYRISGNFSERDVIIDKLARLLLKFGKHTFSGLSPHGKRATSGGSHRSFRLIPLWLITSLGAILLVGWWFAAHYVVKESLHQVLSALM